MWKAILLLLDNNKTAFPNIQTIVPIVHILYKNYYRVLSLQFGGLIGLRAQQDAVYMLRRQILHLGKQNKIL